MKSYIIISPDGYTYQPNSEVIEPDIENLQVLGFSKGNDGEDAVSNFLAQSEWIGETSFDKVFVLELKKDSKETLSRNYSLKSRTNSGNKFRAIRSNPGSWE